MLENSQGRYTPSNLVAALRDPGLFVREGERLILKHVFDYKHGTGIDVMDEDWDNLLILDACRFDVFAERNRLDGELRSVVSHGSSSGEFIEANFAGEEFHDTILVTANPHVEELDDDVFFRVCYSEVLDRWDDSLKTIPPSALVDITRDIYDKYPNKRLIVHFMQPHAPYIGPKGRELFEQNEFGVFAPDTDSFDVPDVGIPGAIKEGYVDEEELLQAYIENLDVVLEHAERLVEELNGKSVITSDHGEALGERGLVRKYYGHGRRLYIPELRKVPWLVIPSEERRTVTAGDPSTFERLDEETRDSRLKALGYVPEGSND